MKIFHVSQAISEDDTFNMTVRAATPKGAFKKCLKHCHPIDKIEAYISEMGWLGDLLVPKDGRYYSWKELTE